MTENSNYIVQYVGFKTILTVDEFIYRWTPFATGFKNAGIRTIDLYKVMKNDTITFISRNVWEKKNYFKNFPSGIAAAGGGGGISVTQFGGYWLAKEHLEGKDKMILAFQKEQIVKTDSPIIERLPCSENTPYLQMLEIIPDYYQTTFEIQLTCEHLTQL